MALRDLIEKERTLIMNGDNFKDPVVLLAKSQGFLHLYGEERESKTHELMSTITRIRFSFLNSSILNTLFIYELLPNISEYIQKKSTMDISLYCLLQFKLIFSYLTKSSTRSFITKGFIWGIKIKKV